MKTVLTTTDFQLQNRPAGGIATFTAQLASLLRGAGYEVGILYADFETRPVDAIDPVWQANFEAKGIDISPLTAPAVNPVRYPNVPVVNLSEALTGVLQMADVAYFHDWGNLAFDALRRRRLDPDKTKYPVCVTVLHGPSMWRREAMHQFIDIPDDLNRDYIEKYAAEHSDQLVSPSQSMIGWVTARGWQLPSPMSGLGLPFVPLIRQNSTPGSAFNQLVFYGRLETGLGLFVSALQRLKAQSPQALRAIDRIVLLGPTPSDGKWPARQHMSLEDAQHSLDQLGPAVEWISDKDSLGAQRWLAANASSALVVIPPTGDNFPYAVIEASLIPGLNVLCAAAGAVPEILGERGHRQLFDPQPQALASMLADWLPRKPLPASELAHYDFEAANKRWLAFHEQARSLSKQHTASDNRPSLPSPAVDVCIATRDESSSLPRLLTSLARQTSQNFRVIVVADATVTAQTFQDMAQQYPAWTFIRQEAAESNMGSNTGRNRAAKEGTAPYILFLDANDTAALTLVERTLAALSYSQDDGLVCRTYHFTGDDFPYDLDSGQITAGLLALHTPLGISLTAAAADPNILGGKGIMIRRPVFEALGGFTEAQETANGDGEFYIRAAMAGYKIEVIPETLIFHQDADPGLQKTGRNIAEQIRLLQPYEAQLEQLGLGGMAVAFQGLYQEAESLRKSIQDAPPRTSVRAIPMEANRTITVEKLDVQLWKLETRLALVEDRQTLRGFLKYVLPESWVAILKRIVDRNRK